MSGIFNSTIFNSAVFNTESVAVAQELTSIANAFAQDMGPIHLLPLERRQLRRIMFISKRDEKAAVMALRNFKRKALAAHATMRRRRAA